MSRATDQAGTDNGCIAVGSSAGLFTCTVTPALTAYSPTQHPILFVPNFNSVSAPNTLNINALGPLTLQWYINGALINVTTNDLTANDPYLLLPIGNPVTALLVLPVNAATRALTSGHLYVGNASNFPVDTPASGDLTLANTGAFTVAPNAINSAKQAVVNNRRTCLIQNDTQTATPLVAANFSGSCEIPFAATIVEVDVWGGAGVTGGTVTTTGTGSINLQKFTPNGGAATTLLSGALATASGYACALTSASGTCIGGTTSSANVTISTTALSAGDWIRISAATPDAAQTWYRVAVVYTVN